MIHTTNELVNSWGTLRLVYERMGTLPLRFGRMGFRSVVESNPYSMSSMIRDI